MAELNIDGKFVESDGRYVWVPNDSSKAKRPIVDDELIDWVIREEGFLTAPRDIGDGKMTIGSGLTDPKWHTLYRKKGNKWSEEDNRKAVREELIKRNKWAEDTVPNWAELPEHSKKAMLSYKYNYNFTPANSPLLFKAMQDGRFIDAMYQMDATSKNEKFKKGLEERRKREQEWGIAELLERPLLRSIPTEEISYLDRTARIKPITQGVEAIISKPVILPISSDNYVEAASYPRPDVNALDAIKRLRGITQLENSLKWENQPEPEHFVPKGQIDYAIHGEGGSLKRKMWNDLSLTEKAEMMKVAILNGITSLPEIKEKYNEFASGGSIHIDPSKKGTFTAAASKHGKSVQEFASQVLAHPENYSPAMRKKANFARNAKHWKHGLGGNLFVPGGELDEEYQYATTYLPEITVTPTRAQKEQAWRKREGNIAKSLVSHPTLPNLFSAAEHYSNSIPGLISAPSEVTGVTASEPLLPDVKNVAQLIKVGKVAKAIEDAVKGIEAVPKITAANASKIAPKLWTAAQDAAIARGDVAEAQRLRDLHFKVNAPNTKIVDENGEPLRLYHGTKSKFNAFDESLYGNTDGGMYGTGVYTTPYKDYAENYGDVVMNLYANISNPVDARNLSINDLMLGKLEESDNIFRWTDIGGKRDGVLGKNHYLSTKYPYEVVSHKPSKVKSADAVTYDDKGIRIPLGERDNFNLNDIRYSWLLPFLGVGAASTRIKPKQSKQNSK